MSERAEAAEKRKFKKEGNVHTYSELLGSKEDVEKSHRPFLRVLEQANRIPWLECISQTLMNCILPAGHSPPTSELLSAAIQKASWESFVAVSGVSLSN